MREKTEDYDIRYLILPAIYARSFFVIKLYRTLHQRYWPPACVYLLLTISTRRFFCRPASVSLDATGASGPTPWVAS